MVIWSHMDIKKIKSSFISPRTLAAILESGERPELLDVRAPSEYATEHVPGAKLIPLHKLQVETFLAQHQPGTQIYVLCQTGGRAAKAISQFENAGCADCVLVEGGTQAWIDVGLSVHRGVRTALPIMRQVQIVVGFLAAVAATLALTVDHRFAIVPLLLGCGLLFAGITGMCGMAHLLARMPWNRYRQACTHGCVSE